MRHSALFPANPHSKRTFGGGPPGKRAECILAGQTVSSTEGMQRGIRKDLWPKYFPKCPVARHFVCPRRSMSGAIAKALPTCIDRTLGQVGFALGRKLLRKFTNLLFRQRRRFPRPARGLARNGRLSNSAPGFSASVSGGRVGRRDSVSVIIQRRNFATMRP
jgi:hypothetical protein